MSLPRSLPLRPWLPLLSLGALVGCQPAATPPAATPVVWVSPATAVSQGAGRVFTAILQPRVEAPVGFRVGGRVAARLVETGQSVRAGQPLATLVTDDLLTGLHAARQQVAGAEAELAQLQSDEGRLARLSTDGSAPAAELERQRTRVRAAQARLEGARQGEALASNRVDHARLLAPFDGVVTHVLADVGQVVNEGQPLLMLARAGEMEAEVLLPEQLASLARQTPATLAWPAGAAGTAGTAPASPTGSSPRGAAPGALPLTLRELSPVGMGPARQVRARYALPSQAAQNPAASGLRWGLTAEVHWASARGGLPADAVAVPTGALVRRGEAAHVWRVSTPDQKLVAQAVTVLQHTTDGVIVQGLPAGTPVVSAGAQRLVAGTVVQPKPRTHTHLAWQAGDGVTP